MTLVHRLLCGSLVAALAFPGYSSTIRHRAVVAPSLPTITVTGFIRDAVTNQPIVGADVNAEGHKSIPTDRSGKYTTRISAGRNVVLKAEQFGYDSQAFPVFGADGATQDFVLNPRPTVTVKTVSGETHNLDFDSTQFAYLVTFIGYVAGDNANWCKSDGTIFAPNKGDIKKITGPGQLVDFKTCCSSGNPVVTVNVEMKNGDKFPVYFNDSCAGYSVDFFGREPSTAFWQYFKFIEIAEIDFP